MPLTNLTADLLDTLEPQRQSTGTVSFNLSTIGISSTNIELAVRSFPMPKRGLGQLTINHLNETRKYAGLPTYDNLDFTFYDFIDIDIARDLQKWWKAVHNEVNGKTGWARAYKVTGFLNQYGPNGQYDRIWLAKGMFPINFDPGSMDQSSDSEVQISISVSVDKAYPYSSTPSTVYDTN